MLLMLLNPEGSIGFAHFSRFNREALTVCRFPSFLATADGRFCVAASPALLVVPETQNPFRPPSLNSTLALSGNDWVRIKRRQKATADNKSEQEPAQ